MILRTAELAAGIEAIHPAPGCNKIAISTADGSTRYYLRCWRCRRLVPVDRRVFGLSDATTCAHCQKKTG